jgi:hypothetical protein
MARLRSAQLVSPALIACAVIMVQIAVAQTTSAQPDAEVSGTYTFLRDGETVQLSIENGHVKGFVSRFGNSDSDRGTMLDHSIADGTLSGTELAFTTSPIHAVWYRFAGRVERGTGVDRGAPRYYVLRGTLTEFSEDAEHHVASRYREVEFRSMAE